MAKNADSLYDINDNNYHYQYIGGRKGVAGINETDEMDSGVAINIYGSINGLRREKRDIRDTFR